MASRTRTFSACNPTPGVVQPGARYPRDNYPVAEKMIGERVWLFEDTQNDPRVDALTAQSRAAMDIYAFMGPAFYIDGKWAGGITFHSKRTRSYSQREIRLFSGIGDPVMAAVRRIVYQQEMVTGDQLIGVLEIQSKMVNRFHETDMRVMSTLADMVAVAIQNARLYQRVQSYAVLEERNRIARELHDSVSQALYGMAPGARTARAWLDRDPSRVADPRRVVPSKVGS